MQKAIIKRDSIQPQNNRDLVKAIAHDIGKEVAHHIEIMYPDAVKAASSTFLLSVKGCVYNEIMSAIQVNDADQIVGRLAARKAFRRIMKAAYKRIRTEVKQ